ncbi:hypothetical protein Q6247_27330, partial [Klebsiella pneumoniae]
RPVVAAGGGGLVLVFFSKNVCQVFSGHCRVPQKTFGKERLPLKFLPSILGKPILKLLYPVN